MHDFPPNVKTPYVVASFAPPDPPFELDATDRISEVDSWENEVVCEVAQSVRIIRPGGVRADEVVGMAR